MQELRVRVEGMACSSCAARVEGALERMPGVSSVRVDLKAAEARVVIDPSVTSVEKVRQAIVETGYQAAECSPVACDPDRKRGVLARLRGK